MKNVNIIKAFELTENIYQSLQVKIEVWGEDSEEAKKMSELFTNSNELFAELFNMTVYDYIDQQCDYIENSKM